MVLANHTQSPLASPLFRDPTTEDPLRFMPLWKWYEEPTHSREFAERVNGWDLQTGCMRHDLLSLHNEKRIRPTQEPVWFLC